MARKRHTVEQIITKLREAEVELAREAKTPQVCRKLGITVQTYYYTLREAQVLIERWRREYNQLRPHSSLGYRPPEPEAVEWPLGATQPGSPAMSTPLT